MLIIRLYLKIMCDKKYFVLIKTVPYKTFVADVYIDIETETCHLMS